MLQMNAKECADLGKRHLLPMVTQAMFLVDGRRRTFIATPKLGLDGLEDVFTDIDVAVQKFCLDYLALHTLSFGIKAEEGGHCKSSEVEGLDVYWTLDPIDGTKSFVRGSGRGISVMVSLVINGEVVLSAIGDICTGELFFYTHDREGAFVRTSVFRQGASDIALTPCPKLAGSDGMMGKPLAKFSPQLQRLFRTEAPDGLFGEQQVDRGSIGVRYAELWRGATAVYLARPYMETPWDNTPLIGFNRKLGYVTLRFNDATMRFDQIEPSVPADCRPGNDETVVIHGSHLPEFRAWEASLKK